MTQTASLSAGYTVREHSAFSTGGLPAADVEVVFRTLLLSDLCQGADEQASAMEAR